MSTNQKHQRMISNGWNLGHKTVSNRIPQSASWEKIRASQWFMLNKRNAVMSNFDVGFMAQRRRNPRIARREICMFMYIHMYVYIYIYMCAFLFGYLCTFMHGFDSTVRRFARAHLWSRHMSTCEPFFLKRSMYDYKLHVSLLIFVYSLMDSDERASLQKNNVLNKTTVKHTSWTCC